jgi:hypothetical protein
MNSRNKKVETMYALTALLMTPNYHAARIRQSIREVNDVYTTVIQVSKAEEWHCTATGVIT